MDSEDLIIWSRFGGSSLLIPVAQLSAAKGCMWYSSKLSDESLRFDGLHSLRLSRNASLVRGFGMGLGVLTCITASWYVGYHSALLPPVAAIGQSESSDCERCERKRRRLDAMICYTVVAGVIGGLAIGCGRLAGRTFVNFQSAHRIHQRINQSIDQAVRKTNNGGTF